MSDKGQTILLVEDNEDDVFAFQRALKKAEITNTLEVAENGQQALEYLKGEQMYRDRAKFPLPFIIFLDLKLPYVDGFEILEWLRTQRALSAVPVCVLTSSAEIKDKDRAYSLGARTYMVKPPSARDLLDVMNSLQSFWMRHAKQGPVRIGPPT